jgi:hypothetical protein
MMVVSTLLFGKVNMGANGFDRTGRRLSCMPRMSVGLVNHPTQI